MAKGIMIAIGKGKPAGGDRDPSKLEEEMGVSDEDVQPSEEEIAAAGEFSDAIKSGDAKLIALAFRNLKDCC